MKLNQEQRQYINNQIDKIYSEKTKDTSKYYSGSYYKEELLPEKYKQMVQELRDFEKAELTRREEYLTPIREAREEAKAKVLFATEYEEVKDLLNTFKSSLENL